MNEEPSTTYEIKLDIFEGPLDLLLYLIKKNEIDIYNIPVALIAQQYLEYLDIIKSLNLDLAGEYLVMASTLIHIKSRMLLPAPEEPSGEELEDDPRADLVRRLQEYERFKQAAEDLDALPRMDRDTSPVSAQRLGLHPELEVKVVAGVRRADLAARALAADLDRAEAAEKAAAEPKTPLEKRRTRKATHDTVTGMSARTSKTKINSVDRQKDDGRHGCAPRRRWIGRDRLGPTADRVGSDARAAHVEVPQPAGGASAAPPIRPDRSA